MTGFMKLTNILINTNDIHKILISPNKYNIQIMSKKNDGFMWLFGGTGFGFFSSSHYELEICETKHPTDYKIVSEWINKI